MQIRLSIIILLIVSVMSASGCNGSDKESETKDDSGTTDENAEGTDEPAWVNSMYLSCNWDSVETRTQVGVACSVASSDPNIDLSAFGVTEKAWRVLDSKGTNIGAETKKNDGKNVFILDARTVIGLSPQATMSDGAFDTVIERRFEDVLEGLNKGGKLDACFNAEIAASDCFDAIGITLPGGDRYSNANAIKPEDSACANKGSLPEGMPCEMSSDAITGDLDQAREWYREGNDIVAADGTIKSADFCDANGVKPQSPKGTTNVKNRWYPYWKAGERPCFATFEPQGAPALWTGKRLVYNSEDGVDGQPFCMFAIMSEPTIFGGQIYRMHIVKNPKLFDNAANGKELTLEAFGAFVEHFACQPKP